MFKPKIIDKDEKVSGVDEIEEDDEEEQEELRRQKIKKMIPGTTQENKPKERSQLTVDEVVDMIEGHISRAGQLLQLLK